MPLGHSRNAAQCRVPLLHDASEAWPFVEVIRIGHDLVIDNLSSRFGTLPMGRWNARPEKAIVLPLTRAGQATPSAFLVAGVSPHRALDDRYRRFFRAAADQVASLVANARAYEAEKQRAEALAEVDRAKTIFFNNISHEFRTPLTLLLGPVDDALSDREHPLPGVHHQRLELAHHNALRLLRLVNALLDFSRHEAGRQKAVFVPTDLCQLTRELASQFRSATDRAGLRLSIDCHELSEPAYVDRDMWEKVVLNLVSNAFKFTEQGTIGVRLDEVGDAFQLTVSDTGTGIAPAELPFVFQRFHRVVGAWSRTHEGSGIGLALVQELVKLHGGDITVHSRRGEGSQFSVTIPKGQSHLPADAVASSDTSVVPSHQAGVFAEEAGRWLASEEAPPVDGEGGAPTGTQSVNGARARILLVDDNADLRTYVSRMLAPYYQVSTAVDGQAALEAIRADAPDLVLSDVMMPRLDGFGLIRALRADPATRRICVILLSARAGDEAVAEGVEALADDYVSKPFAVRELLARIRTHLELARTRKRWVDELELANRELETFSYSVAHDLKAPLRAVEGFGKVLIEEYGSRFDENGQRYLGRIQSGILKMNQLIEDLLQLSRQTHEQMQKQPVDLGAIARSTIEALRGRDATRQLESEIEDGLTGVADVGLITIVLENLLGNAWKYTAQRAPARISMGRTVKDGVECFCVRDNGAGSTWHTPRTCLLRSSGYIQSLRSREPVSACSPCTGSFPGMVAGSGPRRCPSAGRRSISRWGGGLNWRPSQDRLARQSTPAFRKVDQVMSTINAASSPSPRLPASRRDSSDRAAAFR